jgi:polyhydroxybutyrate depolymerase
MFTQTNIVRLSAYAGLMVALFVVLVGCDGTSGRTPEFSDLEFNSEQGWHTQTVQYNNENREFKYYVPSSLPDDAPAVMYLHGATIGMDRAFPEANLSGSAAGWFDISEEEGVLLLVPNGWHEVKPVWNDCTPLPDRGTPDDEGFLVGLTDWTTNQANVDSDSVFVYGISNGGQMANRLAVEHPDRYAGIAALISNINANLGEDEECSTPSAPIKALVVSGKNDQTTPFDGGGVDVWGVELLSAPATRDFWVDNNIQGDPPPRQINELTEDNSRVSCEITPAPQTGADVQLCAYDGPHTDPDGIFETTRVTWQFFRDR